MGALTPNDGECHLDRSSGHYTLSKSHDYPSLSHIRKVVKENAVTVLFLVGRSDLRGLYQASGMVTNSILFS